MDDRQDASGAPHDEDRLYPTADAAHRAADRMRPRAAGPLFVVQLGGDGQSEGWLVLTEAAYDRHPRRQDFGTVRQVMPPLPAAASVEVTAVLPGSHDVVSLGTMDAAAAMALVDMLQDSNGLVVDADGGEEPLRSRLPAPTGYVVHVDADRPGHMIVRLTFAPRRIADVHNGLEDLGMPGGDTHSGPASLLVMLDHWAEEHGYRFVHTAERLNQPIDQYLADLDPADRQRVVIAFEEDDDDEGIVRIAEAVPGSANVVEVAALTMDWLASLPPAR